MISPAHFVRTNPAIVSDRTIGWLLDSPVIGELLARGVRLRIKDGTKDGTEGGRPIHQLTRRVLLLAPRARGFSSRMAEVRMRLLDHPDLDEPLVTFHVRVYGPVKSCFRRERLHEGAVASADDVLKVLRHHLMPAPSLRPL